MVLKPVDKGMVIQDLEQFLRRELLKEWTAQGHFMNGKVVSEAEFVTKTTVNLLTMDLYVPIHGAFMETGTGAAKIPYSGRSGRGGRSKYIQALISYVQKRMRITELTQAKSIAFAIAETQRKEGMPTRGSYRFSTTGKRTGWIQTVFDRNETAIRDFLFRHIAVVLETRFENMITKYQRKFREK